MGLCTQTKPGLLVVRRRLEEQEEERLARNFLLTTFFGKQTEIRGIEVMSLASSLKMTRQPECCVQKTQGKANNY